MTDYRQLAIDSMRDAAAKLQNPVHELFDATPTDYPDEASWLEARRETIGASDTAGILGEGYAMQSALTVYAEKIGQPIPREELDTFKIGKLMEPALRLIFTDITGMSCEPAGDTTIWRNAKFPWLSVTLDALVADTTHGVVSGELKNVGEFAKEEWADGGCPLKHQIQCQHGMLVLGTSVVHLFGLVGGNRPEHRIIERNEEFIEAMQEQLRRFWNHVTDGVPPDADHSVATALAIKALHPDDDGSVALLPDNFANLVKVREEATRRIKIWEIMKQEADNRIKLAMGPATYAMAGDRILSLKTTVRQNPPKEASESKFRVLRTLKRWPKGIEVPVRQQIEEGDPLP